MIVKDDILRLKNEIQVLQQQNQVIEKVFIFCENFYGLIKCKGYDRLSKNTEAIWVRTLVGD